jgi:hypothetical protein
MNEMAIQGSGGMILTWKPDYEENLPHFHFSHHIFHVNCPGMTNNYCNGYHIKYYETGRTCSRSKIRKK